MRRKLNRFPFTKLRILIILKLRPQINTITPRPTTKSTRFTPNIYINNTLTISTNMLTSTSNNTLNINSTSKVMRSITIQA
uniref:Uncharacterized protein n=1 Tax=Arcella intermedia TaxID=1963864 RepID=A0A6B2LV24_9EUKA